jgi:hypothetical protein
VAKIDLSEAYQPHAKSVIRTIRLNKDSSVMISDLIEWTGTNKLIQWQMLTNAEISISGSKAELFKAGYKIVVSILKPADAIFEVFTAELKESEMKNIGYKQLIFRKIEKKNFNQIVISIGKEPE